MTTLQLGLMYGGATLLILFSGMPIAFALGAVATLFMLTFMPCNVAKVMRCTSRAWIVAETAWAFCSNQN